MGMAASRRAARAVSALWLVLAAGCTVGPDYKMPEPIAKTESFHGLQQQEGSATRAVTGATQLANWWTSLADPALDDLIKTAIESNLDYKIAQARVREARAQRQFVNADRLPQVNGSGGYSRSRSSDNANNSGRNFSEPSEGVDLYSAGFDASWELDVFGRVQRNVEAADADIQVAEENRRDVLVSLLSEVAVNYVQLRGAQRRISLTERSIQVQFETLNLTKSRFDAGLTNELDVAQARSQLAARESQLPPQRQEASRAAYRLGVLLGQEPGALLDKLSTPGEIPRTPAQVPVGLPSELLRRRPDVRAAERNVAAATARIGAATADLYPRFTIAGDIGLSSSQIGTFFNADSRFWSIGPSVTLPIFNGGRIRANIQVQEARQEQAALQFQAVMLRALEDVENALVALSYEQVRRDALVRAVDASRRAFDLAKERYAGGVSDFLNVLDTQRLLYLAEDELVLSDQTVTVYLVSLYKALGGGWEGIDEPNLKEGLAPEAPAPAPPGEAPSQPGAPRTEPAEPIPTGTPDGQIGPARSGEQTPENTPPR